jgi:short subunit dehydrogenase-like uncharacterized protein
MNMRSRRFLRSILAAGFVASLLVGGWAYRYAHPTLAGRDTDDLRMEALDLGVATADAGILFIYPISQRQVAIVDELARRSPQRLDAVADAIPTR